MNLDVFIEDVREMLKRDDRVSEQGLAAFDRATTRALVRQLGQGQANVAGTPNPFRARALKAAETRRRKQAAQEKQLVNGALSGSAPVEEGQ